MYLFHGLPTKHFTSIDDDDDATKTNMLAMVRLDDMVLATD